MKIRKIRLTLPARLAGHGGHEARRIAEAIAGELAGHGQAPGRIAVQLHGLGQNGAPLSQRVARAIADQLGSRAAGAASGGPAGGTGAKD